MLSTTCAHAIDRRIRVGGGEDETMKCITEIASASSMSLTLMEVPNALVTNRQDSKQEASDHHKGSLSVLCSTEDFVVSTLAWTIVSTVFPKGLRIVAR